MKFSYIIIALLVFSSLTQAQTWKWSVDNPVPGNDLNVFVNGVEIQEDMHVVGFYFQNGELVTSDINYIVQDGGIKMTLKVPETNWLRLVIKDENNEPVAGDHRNISWAGAPAKSSTIDYANATAAYYRVMGLSKDNQELARMYREAILAHPEWLSSPAVLRNYYFISKSLNSEEDLTRVKEYLQACETQSDPIAEDVLISAIRIAKETGDTVLYSSLRKKLDETYPQSILRQEEYLNLFNKATALADRVLLREQFKSEYPLNEYNKSIYDRMTVNIIQECARKDDWDQLKDYIGEIMDPSTKASVCNEYAWTLAGEGLENDATGLDLAQELSNQSLLLLTPDIRKPTSMSQSEWERNLEFNKAMYGDTYALILFKQGKYDEAVDYQQMAVSKYDFRELEMNERYAIYLDKAGKQEEMLSFLENMIKSGTASAKMKEMHEQVWTNQKTQAQLYDQYLAQLEAVAKMKMVEEVKGKWLELPSNAFTLKDLDGKTVSLADYKGKTVILDFWATWCGPCKASFPGMQNAVNHYSANDDVVFFFVNTWERGADKQEKAKKFIDENKYTFRVLMDADDQVVKSYNIEGIPTKIIIGPDQKIRFKSVGYSGNNEQLVAELITMVEMAQNGGKMVMP